MFCGLHAHFAPQFDKCDNYSRCWCESVSHILQLFFVSNINMCAHTTHTHQVFSLSLWQTQPVNSGGLCSAPLCTDPSSVPQPFADFSPCFAPVGGMNGRLLNKPRPKLLRHQSCRRTIIPSGNWDESCRVDGRWFLRGSARLSWPPCGQSVEAGFDSCLSNCNRPESPNVNMRLSLVHTQSARLLCVQPESTPCR